MKLTSTEFNEDQQMMPPRFTCNGKNTNPPLKFDDVPEDTKSLALIMEDLDAPGGSMVHWLVYNMLSDSKGIEEGHTPDSGIEGMNDFEEKGYFGPCPPENSTRTYKFTLYALDKVVDSVENLSGVELIKRITNNVIEKAVLNAKFERTSDEIQSANLQEFLEKKKVKK